MINMIKEYEKILNCRQFLRENLQVFIDAFIEYYGEEDREEIEKKLSEPLLLAYRSPESLKNILYQIAKEVSKEIEEKQIKRVKTNLSAEDLFDSFTFHSDGISMPISAYRRFYEAFKLGPEGREEKYKKESFESIHHVLPTFTMEEFEEMTKTQVIPEKYRHVHPWILNNIKYYIDLENVENQYKRLFNQASELIHKVDPNITVDNFAYYLDNKEIQNLNSLSDAFPKMIQEFLDRMEKYREYREEEKQHEALKNSLDTKYYLLFIKENIDLLREEDIQKLEEFEKNPSKTYTLTDYTRQIFGYGIHGNHIIESFSEEAEKSIQENEEWKAERAKKDRINFFKAHGIDLGDDYQAYVQSKETKKIWPTYERVRQFQESRNKLLNDFNIEYYSNIPSHRAGRQEIESYHFLDPEDSFNAKNYTCNDNQTAVNPNIIKTEDGYKILPLLLLGCNSPTGDIDHNIVHELNHVLELFLKEADENHYAFICGWDDGEETFDKEVQPLDTLHKDETKRGYELFNEIINEKIAQDISEIMIRNKKFVFDSEEKVRYKHTTSYEHTFVLVKEFFEEFKKDIIKSRRNGNIQIIWDKVGKENFDALNELFHEFNEHFSGYRIYQVLNAIMQGRENAETDIYYGLIKRSRDIMKKMRTYSMMHELDESEKEEETQNKK